MRYILCLYVRSDMSVLNERTPNVFSNRSLLYRSPPYRSPLNEETSNVFSNRFFLYMFLLNEKTSKIIKKPSVHALHPPPPETRNRCGTRNNVPTVPGSLHCRGRGVPLVPTGTPLPRQLILPRSGQEGLSNEINYKYKKK